MPSHHALVIGGGSIVSSASNRLQTPNESFWDFHLAGGSARVDLTSLHPA